MTLNRMEVDLFNFQPRHFVTPMTDYLKEIVGATNDNDPIVVRLIHFDQYCDNWAASTNTEPDLVAINLLEVLNTMERNWNMMYGFTKLYISID